MVSLPSVGVRLDGTTALFHQKKKLLDTSKSDERVKIKTTVCCARFHLAAVVLGKCDKQSVRNTTSIVSIQMTSKSASNGNGKVLNPSIRATLECQPQSFV